jgi:hypothetical protein
MFSKFLVVVVETILFAEPDAAADADDLPAETTSVMVTLYSKLRRILYATYPSSTKSIL